MNTKLGIAGALMGVALGLPLLGHHSFQAQYDSNTIISVTGKLTKFDWSNPHVYATVDVSGPDSSIVKWHGELTGGGMAQLIQRGVTKEIAAGLVGQTVTMRGAWGRDKSTRMGQVNLKTNKGFLLTDPAPATPQSGHNATLEIKPVPIIKDEATLIVSFAGPADRQPGKSALAFLTATPTAGVRRIDEAPECPITQQFAVIPTWTYGACVRMAESISEKAPTPARFTLAPGDYEFRSHFRTCSTSTPWAEMRSDCGEMESPEKFCRAQISVKNGETLYLRFERKAETCVSATSSAPSSARENHIQKEIDAGRYQSLEFPKGAPQSGR